MIAIIPALEIAIEPWSVPAAPAAESPLPGEDPASPAAGPVLNVSFLTRIALQGRELPSPGCCGAEVASEEKTDATELADISGVRDTELVGEGED